MRTSAALVAVACCLLGCAGTGEAVAPACSPEAGLALKTECAAATARCKLEGGTEEFCGAICDERADRRQTECLR